MQNSLALKFQHFPIIILIYRPLCQKEVNIAEFFFFFKKSHNQSALLRFKKNNGGHRKTHSIGKTIYM